VSFSSKSEGTVPPEGLKKIYYSIREVSELTGVEAHVLRFWEKEFPTLRPRRGRSGNREYKVRDIDIVKEIRRLLWDQKFTIQGACEQLRKNRPRRANEEVSQPELPFSELNRSVIGELRNTLVEIRDLLAGQGSP
jgi:DNA-binding transcriptional MerR regulator